MFHYFKIHWFIFLEEEEEEELLRLKSGKSFFFVYIQH